MTSLNCADCAKRQDRILELERQYIVDTHFLERDVQLLKSENEKLQAKLADLQAATIGMLKAMEGST